METAVSWFEATFLIEKIMKQQIFSLDKSVLKRTNNTLVKLLGIHLDSQLSWNMNIKNICTKLARVTYLPQKL